MAPTSSGFGPAVRRVLADDVTDQLRDAIVTGTLEPGSRLREDELATKMEVSRGPVREAFVKLEREGLVIIERYKGARVAEWYRNDIEQVFSLRSVLETLAVEWAVRNATDEDIAAIEKVLEQYQTASDEGRPEAIAEVDLAFHDAVVAAAHHEPLSRAWESLRSRILSFLMVRMALRRDYVHEWEPDHRNILDMITQKRTDEAVESIRTHVHASYSRVLDAMERRS